MIIAKKNRAYESVVARIATARQSPQSETGLSGRSGIEPERLRFAVAFYAFQTVPSLAITVGATPDRLFGLPKMLHSAK